MKSLLKKSLSLINRRKYLHDQVSSKMEQAPQIFDLLELHENNVQDFAQQLSKARFWYILDNKKNEEQELDQIYDTHTGLVYSKKSLDATLAENNFIEVLDQEGSLVGTLETATQLLWNDSLFDTKSRSAEEATAWLKTVIVSGIKGWRLPSTIEIKKFTSLPDNPYSQEQINTLKHNVLTSSHFVALDSQVGVGVAPSRYIFGVNSLLQTRQLSPALLVINKWTLRIKDQDVDVLDADPRWQTYGAEQLLATLVVNGHNLQAVNNKKTLIRCSEKWLDHQVADLDYTPCRLPKIEPVQLTDPNKGLWEFYNQDPRTLARLGYVARDPKRDIKRQAVAIDFGTSSTVVAMDDGSGGGRLLRIGVRDFFEPAKPQHFENPTVLECVDYQAFSRVWNSQAYRPMLDWDWMRCAHEAQEKFRDNSGDIDVLASILPRLKQWALRSDEHKKVRLSDLQGVEIEIPTYSERNPVLGQALVASTDDPFDPIELYAWYLGMAINYRERGIFLKYYLSFPVKYERDVKERILASFRRGLQRSLPSALITQHPETLNNFEVNDLASEPAAYAAAALEHLDVEPSDEGVPYAVFDLGGGTADFDYGLLRWANEEEEARGYERVFEHLASSGDNFLGGENLLEHLVFESFKSNLNELRENRIQFTQPIDAKHFSGGGVLVNQTQVAQTNSVILAAKLRDFMESEEGNLPDQLKLELLDTSGKKQSCELVLNAGELSILLEDKIKRGVESFLAELARVVPEYPAGAPIHVLLAGNGTRSRYVKYFFNTEGESWKALVQQHLGANAPEIIVHQPLPMDDANHYAPTSKTGVALGLLKVAPGESTLLTNRVRDIHGGQAPFAWYVGGRRRGRFHPVLTQNTAYHEWQELATALPDGAFNMYVSQSPRALTGLKDGDPELNKIPLVFAAAEEGAKLYARATKPHVIELCASVGEPGKHDACEEFVLGDA